MARITCPKSGTIYSCEHLPVTTAHAHPFFSLSQHKLVSLAGVWSAGRLTSTESYLLYLALLDSTGLVQWRTQATYTKHTDSIVANGMPQLLDIISKINLITHPSFTLPQFAISQDTTTLENSIHWIEVWTNNYSEWYEDYQDSKEKEALKQAIDTRETSLQRLIKSSTPVDQYAKVLADWAAVAGKFPEHPTIHPITKTPTTIAALWRQIIITIANQEKLWRYPKKDIVELIDHCEDNITHGNIYSHTLMKYLREGLARYDDFLGFGPTKTTFTLLSPASDIQEANVAVLKQTAPTEQPKESQYPTKLAYLKALTKWKLSQP